MRSRKLFSGLLISSMLAPMCISACSSSGERVGPVVEEGTPWYTVETIELGSEYSEYELNQEYPSKDIMGRIDGNYVYWISSDYNGYGDEYSMLQRVALYSPSGELLKDFDLEAAQNKMNEDDDFHIFFDLWDSYIYQNQVCVVGYNFVDLSYYEFKLDFDSGELTDGMVMPNIPGDFVWDDVYAYYYSVCGDYRVITCDRLDNSDNSPSYYVVKPDGENVVIDFSDFYDADEFQYNPIRPIAVDEDTVFIGLNKSLGSDDISGYLLDMDTETITKLSPDECSWLCDGRDYRDEIFSDSYGNMCFRNDIALEKIDFNSRSIETVLELDNVDFNRFKLVDQARIVEIGDDEFMYSYTFSTDSKCYLYHVTRAESNPNVGKTILTTDAWGVNIYEAIYRFNSTNEDYFMTLVKSDISDNAYYEGPKGEGDILNDDATFGNALAIKLMSEESPDVVEYCSYYPQLANEDYMLDLKSYYEDSDVHDQLFDNIVEASMRDGHLYGIPVTFGIIGIPVRAEDYPDGQDWMSYEEFFDFTSNVMNGDNVVGHSKIKFVMASLSQNYSAFVNGDEVNFDCDEFRALAQAASDYFVPYRENPAYRNTEFFDVESYYDSLIWAWMSKDGSKLVGYPSADQRGCAFRSNNVVSISKGCANPDGAWSFLETLLGVEVQQYTTSPGEYEYNSWGLPINRVAYENESTAVIDSYNDHLAKQIAMGGMGNSSRYINDEDYARFESFLLGIDHEYTADASIEVIVYEEIQAYLEGDKTLDEVIQIMNDRAQTVMNERG